MHHLVERPSENSYGKRFVIFQVVLPLQFFFYHPNYANFGNTGSRICVFVSASLNCPDVLFHIIIKVGPNFITVCLILDILDILDIRHTKTHFKPLQFTNFCFFPKCAKWLCFKKPPNHINKAKLHAIPIDRK